MGALIVRCGAQSKILKGDWCAPLFDRMCEGVTSFDEFLQNQLWFISFNYDRCFEKYVLDRTVKTFGLAPKEAGHRMREAFIGVHPYGSLGELWRMGPNTQPY